MSEGVVAPPIEQEVQPSCDGGHNGQCCVLTVGHYGVICPIMREKNQMSGKSTMSKIRKPDPKLLRCAKNDRNSDADDRSFCTTMAYAARIAEHGWQNHRRSQELESVLATSIAFFSLVQMDRIPKEAPQMVESASVNGLTKTAEWLLRPSWPIANQQNYTPSFLLSFAPSLQFLYKRH
jgi:hypothetical protein